MYIWEHRDAQTLGPTSAVVVITIFIGGSALPPVGPQAQLSPGAGPRIHILSYITDRQENQNIGSWVASQ